MHSKYVFIDITQIVILSNIVQTHVKEIWTLIDYLTATDS